MSAQDAPRGLPPMGDDWWFTPLPGEYGGSPLSVAAATSITAIDAGVRLISETAASLPIDVFERGQDGRRILRDDLGLARLLKRAPNAWQTPVEFWSNRLVDQIFLGNGYAEIVPDASGFVGRLIPLSANTMEVLLAPDGDLIYRYTDPANGMRRVIHPDRIYHLRSGQSIDCGVTGQGILHKHPGSIATAIAMQVYARKLYEGGVTSSGVLTHPATLGEESIDMLRRQWRQRHQGLSNLGTPIVLEEGMKYQSMSMTPEDGQALESRKFQVEEVARIIGVPPPMIGHMESGTSWGTGISELTMGFVKYTLRSYLVRMEQSIDRDLIAVASKFFSKVNLEGLLRADIKTRFEVYRIGKFSGILTSNECRKHENLDPIDGGDDIWQPTNMGGSPDTGMDRRNSAMLPMQSVFASDAVGSVVKAETGWIRSKLNRAKSKSNGSRISDDDIGDFYRKLSRTIESRLHLPSAVASQYTDNANCSMVAALNGEEDMDAVLSDWSRTAHSRLMREVERMHVEIDYEQ